MLTRSRSLIAVISLVSMAAGGARAGTATTTFNVTASIIAACSTSATDMSFGTYNPASGTALTASSTISVSCTSGSAYTVALNIGGGGGTFVTRHMASGANTLNYNLYTNSARTSVWGDGTGATFTGSGTGSGLLTPNSLTVYGNVPINQDLPVGSYASVITVTVNF